MCRVFRVGLWYIRTMNETQERNYQKLLEALGKLYESTMVMGVEAQQRHKVHTFLKMGQLMLQADLQNAGRSKYGDNAMQRISNDLTERFGGGFRQRNVYYMRDFAGQFSEERLRPQLTWNHYKTLLTVKDPAVRETLEAELGDSYMPVKQFQTLVRQVVKGKSPVVALSAALSTVSPAESPPDPDGTLTAQFEPRKAAPGIYRLTQDAPGNGPFFLDLGFRVLLPASELLMSDDALEGFADGDCVAPVGTSPSLRGFKASSGTVLGLKKIKCHPSERYCYRGVITALPDGDTVRIRVSLGFGVHLNERFRLRQVAVPKMIGSSGSKSGADAERFMAGLVAPGDSVRVYTYSLDTTGCWVADVFFGPKKDRSLNKEIVKGGDAGVVVVR